MKRQKKLTLSVLLGVAVATLAACGGSDSNSNNAPNVGAFKSTVLVSDGSTSAPHTDANLQNGWGIAFNPTGVVWVSDNTTSKSTLYDGNGVVQSLVVTIPPAAGGQTGGPTGIVFNTSTDFQVTANGSTSNALFIWATEAGTIAGWSPKVLPTSAVKAYDDGAGGAVYKGLAIGKNGTANLLYATDFHNGKIDVFDKSFNKVQLDGPFQDPTLPAGFAPFGISVTGNTVFVTYAKVGQDGRTQVNGAGNGVIDTFDTDGHFVKRIATNGFLNSPWGIAMAPANFGGASNDLLIGNFGDGTIDAFNPATGAFIGALTQADGTMIQQKGIWGISFGNNVDNQPLNTLFFAAGPSPTTGIYGRIDVAQ